MNLISNKADLLKNVSEGFEFFNSKIEQCENDLYDHTHGNSDIADLTVSAKTVADARQALWKVTKQFLDSDELPTAKTSNKS